MNVSSSAVNDRVDVASAITDTAGFAFGRSFRPIGEPEHDEPEVFTFVNKPSVREYNMSFLRKSQEDARRMAFEQRSNNWIAETAVFSSISSITRHEEFNALLEMGDSAVKFSLERLLAGELHVHWFPLLKRLSGEDPVRPEDRGVVNRMAEEWIRWGQSKGHLAKDAA